MDSDRIEREAADWLARRDGERWSAADEAAFGRWQLQHTAHRVAVIRLRTAWAQADRLQALGAGVPSGRMPEPGSWQRGLFAGGRAPAIPAAGESKGKGEGEPRGTPAIPIPARRRSRWPWAVAACTVLAMGGMAAWSWQGRDTDSYRTVVGGIEVLPLKDGSRVTLNTDSRIRLRWTATERSVLLDRGEAYFEVAPDTARPFVVDAGGKRVVAVGTRFSVRRDDGGGVQVVVTEGKVRIEDTHLRRAIPPTQLVAGSLARVADAGVLVRQASVDKAEHQLAWRSGFLAFDDTRLADAVEEFNRYNLRQMVIVDPELADLRIGGNLRANNADAFVRVLRQGFPVDADVQERRILLRYRR